MKILLIDDDAFLRDMYAIKFEECKHKVEVADGALAALRILEGKKDFDVILLDMIMPTMTGVELIEEIRNKFPGVKSKCIVLSNQGQQEDVDKAKKAVQNGSPLSSALIYEQLRRHRHSNLETVFLSEFQLATNVIRYPEFAEGVRALLIDKDKSPQWKFKHFSDVPCSELEHFFTPPWDKNPLELN